jgi:glycosyltransferase involved in cell wall biosynthesis
MRVYHLIKGLGRGGAEMLLPEGLREADRARFEVAVGYFLPYKDALVPALKAMNAPVDCFGASNNARILTSVPRVAARLKSWRADVVHCHLPMAGIAGRLAGRIAGVPVVYTEHNLQERYHKLTFQANKRTWRLQQRAIACSQDVADSIHRNIGTHVPVQVVRNGVSVAHFTRDHEAGAALRARLGIAPDAPVMGTVAVFRAQKRLVEWLRVARSVAEALPAARFLLVGAGPLQAEVDAAIAEFGLQDRVVLPGLQDDVRPWLAAMDVYVMSSEFEGLPVAMLEAMACELPAVCTLVGGIGEVVREGQEGHLVPKDAPGALVAPIVALLSDPARRRRVGEAARLRVADAFGMRRMMGELESIYEQAAARG